jgi:hypothetical protein
MKSSENGRLVRPKHRFEEEHATTFLAVWGWLGVNLALLASINTVTRAAAWADDKAAINGRADIP